MKYVRFRQCGGPEVLEIVEAPDPTPGPGEVVVHAEAIAVGWPDIMMRSGVYPWLPPLPVTPGTEMAGRVESVGSGVHSVAPGDPVYVSSRELGFRGGCYAERMCVPEASLITLPRDADPVTYGGLGYYALAHILLFVVAPGPRPRRVLVLGGSGGLGVATVQSAHAAGIEVIATASSEPKAQFVREAGARHVIDHRRDDIKARVLEITAGAGVDRILDPAVGARFNDHFDMLAPWGQIVVYNATAGEPPPNLFAAWRAHAARVPGLHFFSMHVYEQDAVGRRQVVTAARDALAEGRIRPPAPTWFALDDAAQAHRYLEAGKNIGRLFLRP